MEKRKGALWLKNKHPCILTSTIGEEKAAPPGFKEKVQKILVQDLRFRFTSRQTERKNWCIGLLLTNSDLLSNEPMKGSPRMNVWVIILKLNERKARRSLSHPTGKEELPLAQVNGVAKALPFRDGKPNKRQKSNVIHRGLLEEVQKVLFSIQNQQGGR
ncbi:hypothetical protein NC653_019955 [Populus alba x Populus x berolinensis]|uniref:Uncharacterized protein n=1 Tax=Populus alba x Populus x berolinensis TaxID=444605 RepID=A0AAD6QDY0_9ROSI|nr:hypothetical protein NC653_019955 [Populus alba x Populus x berolinensis]